MLNILTDYHETTVEYEGQGDERIRQACLGWTMGGCDTVWADVLQRILCKNGRSMVGGCSVLELGAGCGQLGLLASNWASHVDITDGDEEEVTLIGVNVEQHLTVKSEGSRRVAMCAVHLDWSRPKDAEGRLLGREAYDVILASQVSYIPAFIPDLARTIRFYLAPGGTAYLYNDQVGRTPLTRLAHARSQRPHRRASSHPWQVALHGTTQAECRALLDRTLFAEGLHVEALMEGGSGQGGGLEYPPEAVEVMRKRSASYLLRITWREGVDSRQIQRTPTDPPPPPLTGVAAPIATPAAAAAAASGPALALTPASGGVRLAVGVVLLAAGLAIGAVVVRRARRG